MRIPVSRGRLSEKIVKSNLIEPLAKAQYAEASDFAAPCLASAPRWINVSKSDHCVQFYETDFFLVESVSEFIGAGLGAGDAGIIVATPSHREAIEARLAAHGIDLAAVLRRKQLILLDAAHTLSQFMVDGCPNAELFEKAVAPLIVESCRGRRGLRAFGEMVALLWAGGNKSASIRLEEFWNKLGAKHSFALLCAYPIRGFDGTENGEGFEQVCKSHKRVIPAESFSGLGGGDEDRVRSIALLQQKAGSLEKEIAHRRHLERELRLVKNELDAQSEALRFAREQLAHANEELKARDK